MEKPFCYFPRILSVRSDRGYASTQFFECVISPAQNCQQQLQSRLPPIIVAMTLCIEKHRPSPAVLVRYDRTSSTMGWHTAFLCMQGGLVAIRPHIEPNEKKKGTVLEKELWQSDLCVLVQAPSGWCLYCNGCGDANNRCCFVFVDTLATPAYLSAT